MFRILIMKNIVVIQLPRSLIKQMRGGCKRIPRNIPKSETPKREAVQRPSDQVAIVQFRVQKQTHHLELSCRWALYTRIMGLVIQLNRKD